MLVLQSHSGSDYLALLYKNNKNLLPIFLEIFLKQYTSKEILNNFSRVHPQKRNNFRLKILKHSDEPSEPSVKAGPKNSDGPSILGPWANRIWGANY